MENQGQGNGPDAPPEKERSAEQLAAIHAAMMEELGISRMDTLPLADKDHHGLVPLNKLPQRKALVNAAVARWHNIGFDDVDEAAEQLDSIADGQLYRLRRDASSGPSHAPSGRGGHSYKNIFRGGRGGSPARTSPPKGSRGGRASGLRGGRNTFGGGGHAASSSSTSAIFFNNARRGAINQARLEKTIAMLKATPRSAPPSDVSNPPQALSRPNTCSLNLSSPEAFMVAMGLKARPASLSTPVEPKPAASSMKATQKTFPPNTAHAKSNPASSMPLPDADILGQVPKSSSSRSTASIVGGTSEPARTLNRSTGLASSIWATTDQILPLISNKSSSITTASIASTSTLSLAAPAATTSLPAPVLNASTQLINSNVAPMSLQATSSEVSMKTKIDDSRAPRSGSLSAGVFFNGSDTLNYSEVPTSGPSTLDDRGVLIEKNVKANRNGGADRLAKARIRQEVESLLLELEVTGLVLLQTPVSGKVFIFTTPTNMTFSVDPDTYNISFRLLHEASAFEEFLPGPLGAVPTLNAPTASTEPVHNLSGDTNISSVPKLNASLQVTNPTTLHALPAPVESVLRPVEVAGKSSVPTIEASVAVSQPALHLSDCLENSPLIDFSDDVHESPSPKAESALDDLAFLNYDPCVIDLLNELNESSSGNFWSHNNGLSGEAILEKVEDAVEAYFAKRSSLFTTNMPEDVKLNLIKDTSRSVVEAARTEALESKVTETEHMLLTGHPPSPIVKTRHPQDLNNLEKKCKYSVKELLTRRVVASTVKEELIERLVELQIDGKSPPQVSHASSSVFMSSTLETASKSARKPGDQVLDSQGASDMKQSMFKASAGEQAASDPTLYTNLLSSIGQRAQSPSKSSHQVAASKDLTRLTGTFLGLNISAESQNATAAVSRHPAQAVMAEFPVRSHPNIPAKTIIEVTNSKEEMAKAHVLGLSSSIWSQPSSSPPPFVRTSLQPLQQPQYAPVYKTVLVPDIDFPGRMKAVTGLEVIDTIPVVAHQMVQPRQENLGFCVQLRPNAIDFNPNISHYASSPDSSRSPLSPRKTNTQTNTPASIQGRLHRSLAERRN